MNQYANDFTRTTEIYYDDLKRCKPLSRAKERRLLKKCKRGNLKAKNEVLEANLKFVFDVAKHYTGRGVPILELISEGNMGLLRAIDKFDDSKNVKFISYAVWWIRQAMSEAIKKRKLINFVDICEESEHDSKLEEAAYNDQEFDFFETTHNSLFSNEDEETNDEVLSHKKDVVNNVLSSLEERERDIIERYYGIGDKKELTLSEIGEMYGLSSERVRQIKKQGMKKLRTQILLMDDIDFK